MSAWFVVKARWMWASMVVMMIMMVIIITNDGDDGLFGLQGSSSHLPKHSLFPRVRSLSCSVSLFDISHSFFQNSLRTLAILMTRNHKRRSTHPLTLLKALCLLRKRRRETVGIACISIPSPLTMCLHTGSSIWNPQTPGIGRAASIISRFARGEVHFARGGKWAPKLSQWSLSQVHCPVPALNC